MRYRLEPKSRLGLGLALGHVDALERGLAACALTDMIVVAPTCAALVNLQRAPSRTA